MKFLRILAKMVFVWLLLFACDEPVDPDSAAIEYETACGWCAGTTLLKIEAGNVSYTRTIPCGENAGITNKSLSLSAGEWRDLLNSYNKNRFLDLAVNDCGVCFDGCDERIRIVRNETIHEIRFLPSKIPEEVGSLRTLLQDIVEKVAGN